MKSPTWDIAASAGEAARDPAPDDCERAIPGCEKVTSCADQSFIHLSLVRAELLQKPYSAGGLNLILRMR